MLLVYPNFAAWLKSKYGSQEKLKKAWSGALGSKETLAGKNIVPQTNPWFFGSDHLSPARSHIQIS